MIVLDDKEWQWIKEELEAFHQTVIGEWNRDGRHFERELFIETVEAAQPQRHKP